MAFPPINETEAQFIGDAFEREVRDLVDSWEEAQRQLQQLAGDPALNQFVGAGRLDAFDDRRRQLMARVREELRLLEERTRDWVAAAVQPQVANGVQEAVESAVEQGARASIGAALGVANAQTIRLLSEEILADLEFARSSAERVLQRHFRATQQTLITEAAINESLLVSEARLENASQRRKRLASRFSRAALAGQLVNVNGRFFQLEDYADIVARTRLTEAATEGAFQAVTAMGIDLVRVSDHGPTDRFCDPFAGKVYSISGRDNRFPTLQQRPPFHPRCRHVLLPFVVETKSPDELRFAIARSRGRIQPGVSITEFLSAAA